MGSPVVPEVVMRRLLWPAGPLHWCFLGLITGNSCRRGPKLRTIILRLERRTNWIEAQLLCTTCTSHLSQYLSLLQYSLLVESSLIVKLANSFSALDLVRELTQRTKDSSLLTYSLVEAVFKPSYLLFDFPSVCDHRIGKLGFKIWYLSKEIGVLCILGLKEGD